MEDKKIRILALCDSPTTATGFAQVAKNILNRLVATGKYQIDIIGINFFGDAYDKNKYPYDIYPAMPQGFTDVYGRARFIAALTGKLEKSGLIPPWDIVFTIQDPFVLEGMGLDFPFAEQIKVCEELWKRSTGPENWFKWIGYFPVDSDLKENWVTRSIAIPDYPVAYCDWGKKKILEFDQLGMKTTFNLRQTADGKQQKADIPIPPIKDRIRVINHGVDMDVFYPLPEADRKKFRKEYFKGNVKDTDYLVVNISRNQPRKDIPRTLKAFALFKQQVPNAHLYLHMKVNDVGGSVHEMARNFNLVAGEDYTLPHEFHEGIGYSIETINNIYNAADLCVTTTLGEGWGFITTEAMATKTPILAPYITSIIDIFGDEKEPRGIAVKAGSTSSEWCCLGISDNERIRPLTNVDDMVEKMLWAYNNPEEVKKITDRAYQWVKDITWDNITKQWEALFDEAYDTLEKDRDLGRRIDAAGRNDPCPCGSGLKFKKCHASVSEIDKYKDWLR